MCTPQFIAFVIALVEKLLKHSCMLSGHRSAQPTCAMSEQQSPVDVVRLWKIARTIAVGMLTEYSNLLRLLFPPTRAEGTPIEWF